MKTSLWPIRTGQRQAPWLWIGLMTGPWAAKLFFEQISTIAITFKLREFVSAPLIITLVASFNLMFNIFVGATCNYTSDRIWTRWGRRKPFLLAGWSAIAVGCIILPEIDTLWLLVGTLFLYEMLRDADNPYESLVNEVVPPHQRGRSTAALTFARQMMLAFFFAILIGRWDDSFALPGIGSFTGEHAIFWIGAVLALCSMAFVGFGIKETPPRDLPGQRPRLNPAFLMKALGNFLREVFGQRQWLTLYGIALAQMIFWIGFGSLAPLLFTEQWGFSKQTYGNVIAISTSASMFFFLPLGGWLADRLNRIVMFELLAAILTAIHFFFFVFLKLRSGDGPPSQTSVIIYWVVQNGVGSVGVVCTVSMMFDFVPRDRLGTVCSGIGITRGVVNIFINNGIGLWITGVTFLGISTDLGNSTAYDYESGFLYLALLGVLATAVSFWFARQVNTGRIQKLGMMEAQEAAAADSSARTSPP
ncbi:MAG TPA: MFS transporter [Opitutaceae bacterium]|nr:MFS transporter [Opitutaceae bacterium]